MTPATAGYGHRKRSEPPRPIRAEARVLERCRKTAVSGFILFHFWAVTAWILPPYSGMVAESSHADRPAGRLERLLFTALEARDGGFVSYLVRNYVDLLGAHQYWDFFAPGTLRIHRYLSVCAGIRESPENGAIDCIEPLYQSFDGGLDRSAQSRRNPRSRSFRLTENLLRLHRPDLLDAFTRYWLRNRKAGEGGTAFLLLHEFALRPGSPDAAFEGPRRDQVIWILPH